MRGVLSHGSQLSLGVKPKSRKIPSLSMNNITTCDRIICIVTFLLIIYWCHYHQFVYFSTAFGLHTQERELAIMSPMLLLINIKYGCSWQLTFQATLGKTDNTEAVKNFIHCNRKLITCGAVKCASSTHCTLIQYFIGTQYLQWHCSWYNKTRL